MTAGGLAGVVAWIATFPLDVFKTRMQATTWDGERERARGSIKGRVGEVVPSMKWKDRAPGLWKTASGAVRKEGWRVMFAGLGPTLVRAVPVSADICTFGCVSTVPSRLLWRIASLS